ncbi:MAG: FAD-binding molybdopterin dehydrogenase [Pseudonocardia sp. SCN 72-86]|nr:MAG: FAD-binding molybdopterin dehydrogenase [Pseudonocardia sp. SCN 72-86]
MDLHTVAEIADVDTYAGWEPGDAWLAGGTYLFSEPQPHLRRLVDLTRAGWPPVTRHRDGDLEIASTCTIAQVAAQPAPLFVQCCRAFLASFKIWNVATIGGNLCNALPAGPMISLTAALHGRCLLVARDGTRRDVPVAEFVVGAGRTVLRAGEMLRSVTLPADVLGRRAAFRQASLYRLGRSAALVIGTHEPSGAVELTVTASTTRPVRVRVEADADAAAAVTDAVADDCWFDDVHGRPEWRRHMTRRFASEIVAELAT